MINKIKSKWIKNKLFTNAEKKINYYMNVITYIKQFKNLNS